MSNAFLVSLAMAVAVQISAVAAQNLPDDLFSTPEEEKEASPVFSNEELMAPGPLPDLVIGSADAPNTVLEYASMTCPHCAEFEKEVMPALKEKYINTGRAKFILREFPLDNLAAAAFMLARCSGARYYSLVDILFEKQEYWVVPGIDAKTRLIEITGNAGVSKDEFNKCLSDKQLFDKILKTRDIAYEKFGVTSTPTFFVNGKRLENHELSDFDDALAGGPKEN